MLWNMRCENMTPSDLWKTDIKANAQMSNPPSAPYSKPSHPSPLSLPAETWSTKGTESPSVFKRKVKRCTFSVRFWKWSHLKAICHPPEPHSSPLQRAVTRGASADGDRHPSSPAFTNTLRDVLQARRIHYVSLKICRITHRHNHQRFLFSCRCHLKSKKTKYCFLIPI